MPSITLKDVPEDLLARLREQAHAERRSMTQQALVLIERGLDARVDDGASQVSDQLAAWRRLAGAWISDESSEDEARAIREARTEGRDVRL